MIAMLVGNIAARIDPYLIIDVNGVGYKVLVNNSIYANAAIDSPLKVFTYTHVREDALELYGFLDQTDLRLFEYLISVSGVGCKTAMGIFSIGKRSDIIQAIVENDVSFFTSVPRLGKKNAQKIIIELKGKLGSKEDFLLTDGESGNDTVRAALLQFGYSNSEIREALHTLPEKDISESEKIRLALKALGKTK